MSVILESLLLKQALTSELLPMLSAPAQTPRLSIPDPMNAPSSQSPNTWGRMNPIAHPTEDHELLCSHSSRRCFISPPWQTPQEEPQHSTCVSCRPPSWEHNGCLTSVGWLTPFRPLPFSSFLFLLLHPLLLISLWHLLFSPSVLFCIFKCTGQLQACSPRISASWQSQPCVSPFSLVWAVSRNLLQMTRLCSKGMSLLWLDYQRLTVPHQHPPWPSFLSSLAYSHAGSFVLWNVLWRGPHGKESKRLLANSSIVSVQQSAGNWILPKTICENLEVDPSHLRWLMAEALGHALMAALWDPEQETQLNHARPPDPKTLCDNRDVVSREGIVKHQ